MNIVKLLKLVADLLKTDTPTKEQVQCARTILNNLIEDNTPIEHVPGGGELSEPLDPDALKAQEELTRE